MDSFSNYSGKGIVLALTRVIQENRAYLSEIDGLIGDGDHGVNMSKGFSLCEERIEGEDIGLSDSLKALGDVLLLEIGGSMGPLYGTLFRKMARACKGQEIIHKALFGEMLASAVKAVAELGGSKVGDKTLMDVLVPANRAYDEALVQDKGFADCLDAMKAAAETGWLSTKDLVAKVGRASRLGERSKGVLDAGATSCNLILQTMAEEMKALL
jgi:dihydroxyacetone kinase-like protein